jgi:cytochrome c556
MPNPLDLESLLARLRQMREELAPRVEELREKGFEVEELLEDCDRMCAFLEGKGERGFDEHAFIARLKAFAEETEQAAHLQQQAEAIGDVMALPELMDQLDQVAAAMRTRTNRPDQARTAAELEEQLTAARRRLEEGEMPKNELENIALTVTAQKAELNRRRLFRSAALVLYWEKQTPEWWAQFSPEQRAGMEERLADWRENREELLGELPLEDRRRLEAMTLEDFERPGATDP